MTTYVIPAKIAKIEQKSEAVAAVPNGKNEQGKIIYNIERQDLGWFILMEGSHEYLFLGKEKPDLQVGQEVTIRIEPR